MPYSSSTPTSVRCTGSASTRDPDAAAPGRRDPRSRTRPAHRRVPHAEGGPPGPLRRHPLALHRRTGLVAGVLARDSRRCGYCGGHATTVDHVLPRSRGGRNSWTNTVAACEGCNGRKDDRTPAEAGMVLRTEPTAPSWAALAALALR